MRFRRRVHFIYHTQNYVDLKPENVLIYIDDVESIIRSELANPNNAPKPSKFVGVPPSRGRGGNQTPRSESIFITGSQPLPSPSSSYGSSPGIDRWGFAMTKLDDQAGTSTSNSGAAGQGKDGDGLGASQARADSADKAAEAFGNVSLNPTAPRIGPGPSLLTQQAPPPDLRESRSTGDPASHTPIPIANPASMPGDASLSTSAMSVDAFSRQSTIESGSSESSNMMDMLNAAERITVKIADLGNGM